ncbi:MAG: hemerythrin domain-containing protein [Rickettsiaceae bacterium]|nr:hemerythrin domain-containing protein [Rickettsiaceae bacterium]
MIMINDHDKVRELLASIGKKKDNSLFQQLKTELIVHNEAEEEVLYKPLTAKAGKLKIMVKVGHTEHDLVMKMLNQIEKNKNEEEWKSLFTVIKKSIEAHINMEENELFNLAQKHFSAEEAQGIAENMQVLKKQYKAELTK